MQDLTQLDQSAINNLLGGSDAGLIPESLITTITVGFVVLNVLGVLFLIVYILGLIRKWKVQSAILNMQKDIVEIKQALQSQPKIDSAPLIVSSATQTSQNDAPPRNQHTT